MRATAEAVISAALSVPPPSDEVQAVLTRLRQAGLSEAETVEASLVMISTAWLARFGHTGTTRKGMRQHTGDEEILAIASQAEEVLSRPDPVAQKAAENLIERHAMRGATGRESVTRATQQAFDQVRERAVAQLEAGLRASSLSDNTAAMARNLARNIESRESHTARAARVLEWVLLTERLWTEQGWTEGEVAERLAKAANARRESLLTMRAAGVPTVATGCRYLLAETAKVACMSHQAAEIQDETSGLATAVCALALEEAPRA